MLNEHVFQCLLSEGMAYSQIQALLNEALDKGSAESATFGIRLITTNSGFPVEHRIERF